MLPDYEHTDTEPLPDPARDTGLRASRARLPGSGDDTTLGGFPDATAALAIKTYWYRLKRLFRGRPTESEPQQSKPQPEEQDHAGRDGV